MGGHLLTDAKTKPGAYHQLLIPPASLVRRVSNLCIHQNHLGCSLNQAAGPTPRASDSLGLEWGPRIFMSNKFPGDAENCLSGNHSENHTSRQRAASLCFHIASLSLFVTDRNIYDYYVPGNILVLEIAQPRAGTQKILVE